jgi:hypothetical protein
VCSLIGGYERFHIPFRNPKHMLQSVIQIRTFSTKYKYITVGCARTSHGLNSVAILSPCSKSFLQLTPIPVTAENNLSLHSIMAKNEAHEEDHQVVVIMKSNFP